MDHSSWVEDVHRFLENVEIEDDVKEELRSCVSDIQSTNVLSQNQNPSDSEALKYILILNKVAKVVVVILQKTENLIPSPFNIVVKVITAVLGAATGTDVAKVVIQRFEKVMSGAFITRCRAACQKIVYCVRYVQSMPRAPRDDQEKMHLIQLLSKEFPLHDVFTEVLELGDKIKRLVADEDIGKFKDLMMNVERYCTLTTYVELFLLHRIAVQKAYGADSAPLQAILLEHRNTDKVVLSFVHRPTVTTIRFVFKIFNINVWPVLLYFIVRRQLFLESLNHLSMKKFQIKPMKDPTKAVCIAKVPICKYEQLFHFKGRGNIFRLEQVDHINNLPTFTIKTTTGEYVTSEGIGTVKVKPGEPSEASRVWNIVKVFSESEVESPGYVIWLAQNRYYCLSADRFDDVGAGCIHYPDRNHIWILNQMS